MYYRGAKSAEGMKKSHTYLSAFAGLKFLDWNRPSRSSQLVPSPTGTGTCSIVSRVNRAGTPSITYSILSTPSTFTTNSHAFRYATTFTRHSSLILALIGRGVVDLEAGVKWQGNNLSRWFFPIGLCDRRQLGRRIFASSTTSICMFLFETTKIWWALCILIY